MDELAIVVPVRRKSERCRDKLARPFDGSPSCLLEIALSKLIRLDWPIFVATRDVFFQKIAMALDCRVATRSKESVKAEDMATVHSYMPLVAAKKILIVNPCHPFMRADTIRQATFRLQASDDVFSVRKGHGPIFINGLAVGIPEKALSSKEGMDIWWPADLFYGFDRQYFLDTGRYWDWRPGQPLPIRIDERDAFDINTEGDYMSAETLYRAGYWPIHGEA